MDAPVAEVIERIYSTIGSLPSYAEEGIPALLQEMRWVYDNPHEPNPCPQDQMMFRALRGMYRDDYMKFRDRLEKMEVEFLQWKTAALASSTKSPSEWDGKGPCPTCKHEPVPEDMVQWKLEELLEEPIDDRSQA